LQCRESGHRTIPCDETSYGAGARLIALLLGLSTNVASAEHDVLRHACDIDDASVVLQAESPSLPGDSRAVWLDATRLRWTGVSREGRFRLYLAGSARLQVDAQAQVRGHDGYIDLVPSDADLPETLARRFAWTGDGLLLNVPASDRARLRESLASQWLLTNENEDGRVQGATRTQTAALLDALFAEAAARHTLTPTVDGAATTLRLWAPTADAVSVCLHADARAPASDVFPMRRDPRSGIWQWRHEGDWRGRHYRYLVDVVVPGVGRVRNRVVDPYAVGLSADSQRAWLGDLDAASTQPAGWRDTTSTNRSRAPADQVIYELHVRDFSIGDRTVPEQRRGKYLAFAERESAGVRHLRALAEAGVTDVHLLPVFDFATVPERGCATPDISGRGASEAPQSAVAALQSRDCFNWGYDPLHFGAPEGSYAGDADDGAARIREFRAMVQALHGIGLNVGMDVVYNHTNASGQDPRSVLDRIVPGYYHRLDAQGRVTTSTCCANTATEHRMMAKLMIDTAVRWVRDYRIDAFRFDLMGHQPRAAMEQLQEAVDAAAGRHIPLLGEGWNFGEVEDGARFVQASQLSLNGSGIATFSDRARDAVRGGGPGDNDVRLISQQGFVNGLHYDRNDRATGTRDDLLRAADLVRVGLAGSLRDYVMTDHRGQAVRLSDIGYGGVRPAGYAGSPDEVVNYVENHDNQTLFDINAFKLPTATSRDDRARVQMLAAAINLFSQGIAYFHAGVDTLRSKSLDRNSYDSGDWFNRIDWSYRDNFFGSGLPPRQDNGATWDLMRPLLADSRIKPEPAQIAWMRDAFRDLLRIRAGSTLFRLRRAADIRERLRFVNTGPAQEPTVLAALLDGRGYAGAGFERVAYFINVDRQAHAIDVAAAVNVAYVLHPLQRSAAAADARPREAARFDRSRGRFTIPPRSAVVFVVEGENP